MSKVDTVTQSNIALNNKLVVTTRILEHASNLLFTQFGMTARTYEILMRIHNGENITANLASMLRSSPSNITHKTKLLEKQGYIQRLVGGRDKRVWHFSLTPHGKQALKTVQHLYDKATQKLYAQFSRKERNQFFEFLDALESHLESVMENKQHVTMFVGSARLKNKLKK